MPHRNQSLEAFVLVIVTINLDTNSRTAESATIQSLKRR